MRKCVINSFSRAMGHQYLELHEKISTFAVLKVNEDECGSEATAIKRYKNIGR